MAIATRDVTFERTRIAEALVGPSTPASPEAGGPLAVSQEARPVWSAAPEHALVARAVAHPGCAGGATRSLTRHRAAGRKRCPSTSGRAQSTDFSRPFPVRPLFATTSATRGAM